MQRTILSAIALAFAAAPAAVHAQECVGEHSPGTVRLAIDATEVRNAKGAVVFTVYPDDRRRFLVKGGTLLRARLPAAPPLTRACFWLPPASYAIAIYHDENGDRHFNHMLFIPQEGFGFSNDAPTTLGLPSLAAVRFTLPAGGTTLHIRMRYSR